MLKDNLIYRIHALKDRKGKILSLLHYSGKATKTSDIRLLADNNGIRDIAKWNISDVLGRAEKGGLVICLPEGWQLTPKGAAYLRDLGIVGDATLIVGTKHKLATHVASINCPDRRRFIGEAVSCFEVGLHRSAVVLSWVGALWIIQRHVADRFLLTFNAAGQKRFAQKFKVINHFKDFAALKESDFLELCQDASIIDKAEKAEFKERLDLRNRCGHPNSLIVADHAVANHLEMLLHNVYLRY